jgi:UDP-N-acetylmuramate dehydrogenase
MLEESIAKRLINCGNIIKYNVDGSRLSSFKSGGAIDNLVYPVDLNSLIQCSSILRENDIPFHVIGNGTNILISDKGIKKVLLRLTKLNDIKIEDDKIYCHCGALIHNITKKAVDNNLSGLEWAIGIPGTIGGAITMNAGAFNGEIADIIEYVDVIDNGIIKRMSNTDMRFCYRDSIVNHQDIIIIGAMLKLKKDGLNEINERLNEYIDKRNKTQPRQPSCGSVFKRKNNN